MQPNVLPGIEPVKPELLAELRSALLVDLSAQDRLAAIEDRHAAIANLVSYAANIGLTLDPTALGHELRHDPVGIDRFMPWPVTGQQRISPQWLPVGLSNDGVQMTVEWAHFAGEQLTRSFFEGHMRVARNRPISQLFGWRTPLGAMLSDPDLADPPELDGIVFHMSRCGSTLVARQLGQLPDAVVLSEPAPVDDLIQFCASQPELPLETKVALLRAMVFALTPERSGPVRYRFLKADGWHAGSIPLFRAAFPRTPFVFLYRDPVEVMLSQRAEPGWLTVPGTVPRFLGIADDDAIPGVDFSAKVIGTICAAAADHAAELAGPYINYAELPLAITSRILPHFGIEPDAATLERITQISRIDSKRPTETFDRTTRESASDATPEILVAVERHLAEPLARIAGLNPNQTD
jgi:hypothetical protein